MNISDAARELPRFTPYDGDSSLYSDSKRGEWVRYADHATATAALTLELENLRQQLAEAREDSRRLDSHAIRLTSILQRFAEELPTHEWDFVLSTFDSPIDAALNPPTDEK